MQWPIFGIVSTNTACTTLLGTSPVRFWEDTVPEQYNPVTKPYVVWSTVGGAPENYPGELPTMDSGRLQVDVYGATKQQARNTALAIRNAVEPHAHMVSTPIPLFEPDTKLYRYILEFQFWTLRPT